MKRKQTTIAIEDAPVILSRWRRLANSDILSDRQLWGALNVCWTRLCELDAAEEKKWTEAVKR